MRTIPVLIAVLLISACGEQGTETTPASMTGRWTGAAAGINVTADLVQQGNNVTGTSTIQAPTGNIQANVTGTNTAGQVNLNLQAQGQPGGTFTGSFTDNATVAGTLTITGFPQSQLILRRQ